MKTEKFTGTLENAYGKQLTTEVKYAGEFEAFESIDEVKTKGEFPKDSEILSFVNTKRKNNERQKAMTAALTAAGIEKPDPNNPDVVAENTSKGLDKLDMPEDQKEMIRQMLAAAAAKAKEKTASATDSE